MIQVGNFQWKHIIDSGGTKELNCLSGYTSESHSPTMYTKFDESCKVTVQKSHIGTSYSFLASSVVPHPDTSKTNKRTDLGYQSLLEI